MLNKIQVGWVLISAGALLWFAFHIPSILYGTSDVPLYVTHIGDEQVPVNGALHVLNEKNLLALRDANKAYYGPLMVMLAVPAAAADYARTVIFEDVSSPLEYRNYVVWNWGGILMWGRIMSVLVGFLGLYILAKILMMPTINRRGLWLPVVLSVVLLATEYFYFHYTAHFRHWVFLNTILLGQIYLYLLMKESNFASWRQWLLQAGLSITTFGISYLGILFQVVWASNLFTWLGSPREYQAIIKRFLVYSGVVLVGLALMVCWHPYAFFRIVGIVGADLINDTGAAVLEEEYGTNFSFDYYTELFFYNHFGLTLAVLTLLLAVWLWGLKMRSSAYTPVLLVLIAYVLLFGFKSHHSTHYFLPAIVLIHLLAGMLLVKAFNEKENRQAGFLVFLAVGFIGIQLAFNIAVLGKLTTILRTAPPEVTLAQTLIAIEEREGGNTLLSGCGPLPVPHTRAAYADFASRADRDKTSLYSTMLADDFPFPDDSRLLDAYYDDNLPAGERLNSGRYDRIVICHPFNPTGDPNQRLLHESRLLNYWNLAPFVDRYEFVKPDHLRDLNISGVTFR